MGQYCQRHRPDRRVLGPEIYGLILTTPLLNHQRDGRKMGKSQGGVNLAERDMLSPYEFLAVLAQHDRCGHSKFLKIFTELPVEECEPV